jgi:tetratricopeptide (TPR) repeat protein
VFFHIVGQDNVPFAEIKPRLIEIASQYVSARQTLSGLSASDDQTRRLIEMARNALNNGNFTHADRDLAYAATAEIDAARNSVELMGRAEAVARQRLINAVADQVARAEVALIWPKYTEAAAYFGDAIELLPKQNISEKGDYQLRAADALYRSAISTGDLIILNKAVALYETAFFNLTFTLSQVDEWSIGHVHLGRALMKLAEHDSDTNRFTQALDALSAAVDEKAEPLDWSEAASAHRELGDVLIALDEAPDQADSQNQGDDQTQADTPTTDDAGSQDNGVTNASQAVDQYRLALRSYKREDSPTQWARIEDGLGYALARAVEEGVRKTDHLNEAMTNLHLALEETPRDKSPLQWARIQSDIGYVLGVSGEQNSKPELLNNSITT